MTPPSVGIVGCGSITDIGILPHLVLGGFSVGAICDTSESRLEYIGDKYEIADRYTDLGQMLSLASIDAVVIATPIGLHYEQAKACLEAGKHTYVQKTMTSTSADARKLVQLAKSRKLQIAASPGQILLPAFADVAEKIRNGDIGTVYSAFAANWAPGHEYESTRSDVNDPSMDPAWYYQPGAGPMRDMGVYALHGLIAVLGEIEEVFAFASRPVSTKRWHDRSIPIQTDDNYVVNLRFKNGVLGQVATGYASNPDIVSWGHTVFVGSTGALEVSRVPGSGSRYRVNSVRNASPESRVEEFGSGLSDSHDRIGEAHVGLDIIDFIKAIHSGRPPGASADIAAHAIEVVSAIEESAMAGDLISVLAGRRI